jgi:Ca2+-binding EF-hand superfamily protein
MIRALCMVAILALSASPALFAQDGERPQRGERGERPERGERGEGERPGRGEGRPGRGEGEGRPGRGEGEGRPGRGPAMDPERMQQVRELTRLARRFSSSEGQVPTLSREDLGDDELFDRLDADEDGTLTLREMMADIEAVTKVLSAREHAVLKEEFTTLDRNEDGKLDAEELGERFKHLLEKAEKEEDGTLNVEEWTRLRVAEAREAAQPQRRMQRDFGAMFDRIDTEGEGKLTREQMPERLRANFDAMDADDDGYVTREEFIKYMEENMRQGARPGRGERGPRRGEGERRPGGREPQRENRPEGEEDF